MNNAPVNIRVARRFPRRGLPVRRLAVCGLLGALTTLAVAWLLALGVDPQQGVTQTATAHTNHGAWTVTAVSRAGSLYVHSLREVGANWSAEQATGAPDTPGMGDQVTAWASQSPDGQQEWMILDFDSAVTPRAVRVYETYSPGALYKVAAYKDGEEGGEEIEAWNGADPFVTDARGIAVAEAPVEVRFKTRRVKIYLDSPRVQGWNEIDAVGLVDAAGNVQWAVAASASSTYGSGQVASGAGALAAAKGLVPPWSGLNAPADALKTRRIKREERVVEARGWPMLALWCERDSSPLPPAPAGPPTGPANAPRLEKLSDVDSSLDSGYVTTDSPSAYTGGLPPPPGWSSTAAPGPTALLRVTGGLRVASTFSSAAAAGPTLLPYRPIARGFLVDTLVFGGVYALLDKLLNAPRRLLREVSRLRRGCCIACGYDLGYDFIPGCPECGWRRDGRATSPHSSCGSERAGVLR